MVPNVITSPVAAATVSFSSIGSPDPTLRRVLSSSPCVMYTGVQNLMAVGQAVM